MKALRAFEAAARHLSFKAAAVELGLTSTAISHQIRLLEIAAGRALFNRRPQSMVPTSAGAAVAPVVCTSFDTIAAAFVAVRNKAASRESESANVGLHNGGAGDSTPQFDVTGPGSQAISKWLVASPPRLSLVVNRP